VVEVSIWSLSTTFLLDVGTVLTVGYFCSTNYYFRKVGDKLPFMIKKLKNDEEIPAYLQYILKVQDNMKTAHHEKPFQ
jgi:hypothetical protein